MLLKNENTATTDYLADWPSHYYEIPTGMERLEALDHMAGQGLETPEDSFRRAFCEKRFFSIDPSGKTDLFMRAWTMIQASSASGVSFLKKKRLTAELETYMKDLCLLWDASGSEWEEKIRTEEWRDFARTFIASCTGSKAYCSTLFGFVPIKDTVIAEKIAAEILLVTRDYPGKLGLADAFAPFRQIMCETYCQMMEQGETYLSSMDFSFEDS